MCEGDTTDIIVTTSNTDTHPMESQTYLQQARDIHQWIIEKRRTLHRHPELMYEEFKTSQLVQDTLTELGIPFVAGIAETGVLATVGNGNGPCVALRADMDALPIHEETDVEFKSEVDGKMHACGHDCHTSMLLGAARILKENEADINGTVKLIFQPAEEGGAGGDRMSKEGVLENPDVQRIFGIHVAADLPTGQMGGRAGTLLAAAGEVTIKVIGKGGHAAMPHMAIDPVLTASKVVVELQSIISRELDPLGSGVISICAVHGGEAFNVIPPYVELRGTIRALTLETLAWLQERVTAIAQNVAAAHRCEAEVAFPGHDYPPTVNTSDCWDSAKRVGASIFGEDFVHEMPPVMGGEDFAYFTQRVPGCFMFLGVGNESIDACYSVHHPKFKADEDALPLGSAMHVSYAMQAIDELSH